MNICLYREKIAYIMKTDKWDRGKGIGLLQELCDPPLELLNLGTYSPQFDVFPSAITLPTDSYLGRTAENIEGVFPEHQ